jgi:hypothetical protein
LTLTYGSGGTYGGLDQFDRVVDQNEPKGDGVIVDRCQYGYDLQDALPRRHRNR